MIYSNNGKEYVFDLSYSKKEGFIATCTYPANVNIICKGYTLKQLKQEIINICY